MHLEAKKPMKITVLGAGSWGITLAVHLFRVGHEVRLWEFDSAVANRLQKSRESEQFLPGIRLPDGIEVTNDMAGALNGPSGVVFAVPSHVMRSVAFQAAHFWPRGAGAVSVAKGLEEKTYLRMSEVLTQTLGGEVPVAAFSGPSHAEEVSRQIPTTLVAASRDPEFARTVQKVFHAQFLRVYTSTDLIGVELGGALKNIIAIAAGLLDGMGMGDNTKAALMTRGLHEITRLGVALGAQPKTFSGLTGMGDLFVTCMSRHSRNRLLGEKIGKGMSFEKALSEMVMVAEGVKSTRVAYELARMKKIEVPITDQVYHILYKGKPARDALKDLLSRDAKPEQETEATGEELDGE